MKKFVLKLRIVATIFACLAVMMLVSCNKDDDGLSTSTITSITANVEGGSALNDLIDEVKLVTWNNSGDDVVLATAKFSNGGFKIVLPETVPSNVLSSFNEDYLDEDIKVSNMNVETTYAELHAYNENGDRIGFFYYYKENATTDVEMDLVYANGDVNITGKITDEYGTETWSVYLKKGWNQVFYIDKELPNDKWEDSVTTTSQSGMKWFFDDGGQ